MSNTDLTLIDYADMDNLVCSCDACLSGGDGPTPEDFGLTAADTDTEIPF